MAPRPPVIKIFLFVNICASTMKLVLRLCRFRKEQIRLDRRTIEQRIEVVSGRLSVAAGD